MSEKNGIIVFKTQSEINADRRRKTDEKLKALRSRVEDIKRDIHNNTKEKSPV